MRRFLLYSYGMPQGCSEVPGLRHEEDAMRLKNRRIAVLFADMPDFCRELVAALVETAG